MRITARHEGADQDLLIAKLSGNKLEIIAAHNELASIGAAVVPNLATRALGADTPGTVTGLRRLLAHMGKNDPRTLIDRITSTAAEGQSLLLQILADCGQDLPPAAALRPAALRTRQELAGEPPPVESKR